MKVTKVNYFIQDRRNWSYPLAKCSVILDDVLKLNGVCIYEGVNGKYITFPGRRTKPVDDKGNETKEEERNKNKNEFFHPVEKEFSEYLKSVIIEGYQRMLEKRSFSYIPEEGKISDLNMELENGSKEGIEIP